MRKIIALYGFYIFGLLSLLVVVSCVPQEDDLKPNKTVLLYTLTKLDADKTHKITAPNKIRGMITSADGQWLYVVGTAKASLRSFSVESRDWDNALGDFTGLLKADTRAAAPDLSGQSVSGFAPSRDGVLLTIKDHGLVVLHGSGVAHASFYEQGVGKYPLGAFMPMMVTKGPDSFIYLFALNKAAKGVIFRPYVEPPKLDTGLWDNSFRKAMLPKTHLENVFFAHAQDNHGNLLLADKDGIKRLLAEDIGLNKRGLDNHGDIVVMGDKLLFDGKTPNNHINTMAMIEDRYLVLGMKANNQKTGGFVVADLGMKKPVFKAYNAGLTIQSIATERIRHQDRTRVGAVLTTDKGFILLDNQGEPIEVAKGAGVLITSDVINKYRLEAKDYDKAASGFSGDKVPDLGKDGYVAAAQDKNGRWYLAFPSDVYTLDIVTDQVEAPRAPAPMPPVP